MGMVGLKRPVNAYRPLFTGPSFQTHQLAKPDVAWLKSKRLC